MSSGLDKSLFNLKFTVKQLEMNAKKCAKEEAAELAKVKKALAAGNEDTAKIYAENAIRKKNEQLNYLKLAARVDSVASRVQTANSMNKITGSMKSVVFNMDKALESMRLDDISRVMDKFESQFEDVDVHSQYMEAKVASSTAVSTPADDVSALLRQMADQQHLAFKDGLQATPAVGINTSAQANVASGESLDDRLAKLRSMS